MIENDIFMKNQGSKPINPKGNLCTFSTIHTPSFLFVQERKKQKK